MTSLERNLILVHGLWDDPRIFNRLLGYLEKSNLCVYTPHLPHKGGSIPLQKLAFLLEELINKRFGADKVVDLLGFSMGGLVSRVWLQELGGALRTNSFISVGTPHRGTVMAECIPSWWLPGVADMKRGSDLLRDLSRDVHKLQAVKCSSYFCRWDLMTFPGWQATLPIGANFSVPVLTHKDLISHPKSLKIISHAIFSQ
ncbi:esterase/lipase family protein [Prochlorococcus sp. MIT 1307]|uniref:esterase/lipase family protein n=1 Tax=Prochlorococcus sp. MIT 1307 TaxID=3096219 RepID=UPI002A74C9D5|nr:alpha/beta fold hydrolase [Prochlorococcus sp. MIT 1307]